MEPLFRVRDRRAVARRDETSPSRHGHDVSGPQGLPKPAPRRAAVDHRALPHPRPEAARPGRGMPAAAGPCRLASRVRLALPAPAVRRPAPARRATPRPPATPQAAPGRLTRTSGEYGTRV